MNKYRWIIGIDPDTDKSGVAMLDTEKKVMVSIDSLTFPELMKCFSKTLPDHGYTKEDLLIVVEDSWTGNEHIFRKESGYKSGVNARMGYDVGRCHEVGRLIIAMGEHYGLNIVGKKALRKTWSGPDKKITQKEIAYFIPCWPTRANQEQRDAALLAWNEAMLPIKLDLRTANAERTVAATRKGAKIMKADMVEQTTAEARATLDKILKGA